MIIYHASNTIVEKPILIQQNRFMDFGYGFYTTFNYEQAAEFARKVTLRRKTGTPTINIYSIDEQKAYSNCSVLRFSGPDESWLDFVCANRTNSYIGPQYDMIFGPVANDDVYTTVAAYLNGTFSKELTIAALKVKKLFNQLMFATDKSLGYLNFERKENV